jgi:hypothetical protein
MERAFFRLRSAGGVLFRLPRVRLAWSGLGPLHGACGLPEPATRGNEHQPGGAAGNPSRQPGRRAGQRRRWGSVPALRAALTDTHPARQVGKGLRRADGAPILAVKLLAIQTESGPPKLHSPSLSRGAWTVNRWRQAVRRGRRKRDPVGRLPSLRPDRMTPHTEDGAARESRLTCRQNSGRLRPFDKRLGARIGPRGEWTNCQQSRQ